MSSVGRHTRMPDIGSLRNVFHAPDSSSASWSSDMGQGLSQPLDPGPQRANSLNPRRRLAQLEPSGHSVCTRPPTSRTPRDSWSVVNHEYVRLRERRARGLLSTAWRSGCRASWSNPSLSRVLCASSRRLQPLPYVASRVAGRRPLAALRRQPWLTLVASQGP